MRIIAVHFRAYDRNLRQFFVDKSDVEIHTELMNICPTYVTVSVHESDNAVLVASSMLDQFKRPDKEKYT